MVTKKTKFPNGLIALNCFGVGGANGHVVLKQHTKLKKIDKQNQNRLVLISGTTSEAVGYFLDNALKHKDDQEFLALIDEIYKIHIDGHFFRG